MISPPKIIEHEGIIVVRDDLIAGGTKRRALPALMGGASREFVYASPAYGYAQIAIAHCAAAAGKKATIFCAARRIEHPRTAEARAAGAAIMSIPCGYMSVPKARARAYCDASGAQLMPFGLDAPKFIDALATIARELPIMPREIWAAAGSGCMIRALQAAWPAAKFFAVRVGAEPDAGRATLLVAPEKFERDATILPPFPSCRNYDAKVWRFIKAHASPGALFWNVAA